MASDTAPTEDYRQSYHDGDQLERCLVDGHRFEFDDTAPDEVRHALHRLSVNGAQFSDVPAEYLKYEVEWDPWAETDNVIIDGHVFAVNYDVPADVTTALIELAKREGVRFEDVQRAYRRYEDCTGNWVRDPDFPSSAITYCADSAEVISKGESNDKGEENGNTRTDGELQVEAKNGK